MHDPRRIQRDADANYPRKGTADSIVCTDCWTAYNALDVSEFHHERINHSEEYAIGKNHLNGIENFWNQAKRVLRKYKGIPKQHFHLFLKECEFRFNYGTPKQQMHTLLEWCKLSTTKRSRKRVI